MIAKWFLKLPNLDRLIKQKSPSLPRRLTLGTFGELLILFSTKVNLLQLFYSMAWKWYILHLIKQNCFQKVFIRTQILKTPISLSPFPYRTNLKLHISVTPKMVKEVIMNIDSSKVFYLVLIVSHLWF